MVDRLVINQSGVDQKRLAELVANGAGRCLDTVTRQIVSSGTRSTMRLLVEHSPESVIRATTDAIANCELVQWWKSLSVVGLIIDFKSLRDLVASKYCSTPAATRPRICDGV